MSKLTMFEKSPLITALVEIRFNHPAGDIVAGLIYNALSTKYKQPPEELPVNQIPLQIRNSDPSLTYSPTHKISKGSKSIAFGPRSVSLSYDVFTKKAYPGWKTMNAELSDIVTLLNNARLLNKIERIGVRYVNFFEEKDFISKLSLKFETAWSKDGSLDDEMNVGFIVHGSDYSTKVNINTATTVRNDKYEFNKKGQIIDLDTTLTKGITSTNLLSVIGKAHETTKTVFVEMFDNKYFESLGPTYE